MDRGFMERQAHLTGQLKDALAAALPNMSNTEVTRLAVAKVAEIRSELPDLIFPPGYKIDMTVSVNLSKQSAPPLPPEKNVGFRMGSGSMPPPVITASPLQIARAGLEHWSAGAGIHAQSFLELVTEAIDDPKLQRDLYRSGPLGLEASWAEVIGRTCIFAIYAEQRMPEIPEGFPYVQVDALVCRCKHAYLDQFTTFSDDPIWRELRPPFDWLCGCALLLVMQDDVIDPKSASKPAADRLSPRRLAAMQAWRTQSPETGFKLL